MGPYYGDETFVLFCQAGYIRRVNWWRLIAFKAGFKANRNKLVMNWHSLMLAQLHSLQIPPSPQPYNVFFCIFCSTPIIWSQTFLLRDLFPLSLSLSPVCGSINFLQKSDLTNPGSTLCICRAGKADLSLSSNKAGTYEWQYICFSYLCFQLRGIDYFCPFTIDL